MSSLKSFILFGLILFICACTEKKDLEHELVMAVRNDNLAQVKDLIAQGANPNGREGIVAPIIEFEDNYEILKALIDAKADVNATAIGLSSIIIKTAAKKDPKYLKLVLESGADLKITNQYGENALLVAVKKRRLENVKILLEQDIDINYADHEGRTAIYNAVKSNNLEIVKLILSKNPDLSIKDNKGKTVLQLAEENGNKEISDAVKQQ